MYQVVDHIPTTMAVGQACQLACVPRSGYYRYRQPAVSRQNPVAVEVERLCREHPRYGYRRVTKQLQREGLRVNHKRILALMRKANLLCRRRKRFIGTTDSGHGLPVYPNLARTTTVRRPNQLWCADITYVRLRQGFAYVAVVLDAFSRRAVGWAIRSTIDTTLSLEALQMALTTRSVSSDLIHHSDRGVQYASHEYVALLKSKNITISMSRKGNPYDNAMAESFIKTLKTEEVYLNEYGTLRDAQHNIHHFLEQIYNHKRLHSSIGYQTPVEYEAQYIKSFTLTQAMTVSV